MKKYNIAIIGATGLVGRKILKVLEEYNIPINNILLFASKKSIGKTIYFRDKYYLVEELNINKITNIDFAFFSAGNEVSKIWAPLFSKNGAIVIDNSSYWRMNDQCSLIVPEINIDDYLTKSKIIANPNCSTIQAVLPLYYLDKEFTISRIIYTTYQSISGSGQKGLNDYLGIHQEDKPFYPYDIKETCIPQIGDFLKNGYTTEEIKMINETQKILHNQSLKISATCVRVPVKYCHGVNVYIETQKEINIDDVYKVLTNKKGIILFDDYSNNLYPTSIIAKDNDLVYVGRIRKDLNNNKALLFYCVSDNIRKGAATNAVQIMESIINKK